MSLMYWTIWALACLVASLGGALAGCAVAASPFAVVGQPGWILLHGLGSATLTIPFAYYVSRRHLASIPDLQLSDRIVTAISSMIGTGLFSFAVTFVSTGMALGAP